MVFGLQLFNLLILVTPYQELQNSITFIMFVSCFIATLCLCFIYFLPTHHEKNKFNEIYHDYKEKRSSQNQNETLLIQPNG